MSFFDEVETTVANTRLLQAERGGGQVRLDLKPFEELERFASDYKKRLTANSLLTRKTFGFRIFKEYLEDVVASGAPKEWPASWVLGLLEGIGKFENSSFTSRGERVVELCDNFLSLPDDDEAQEKKEADERDVEIDVEGEGDASGVGDQQERGEKDEGKEGVQEGESEAPTPDQVPSAVAKINEVKKGIEMLGEATCSTALGALAGGISHEEVFDAIIQRLAVALTEKGELYAA